MQYIDPVEVLKHQLDTLCESSKVGYVCLTTSCQIECLLGWLDSQTIFPRFYWKARDFWASEYAALGVVKTFDSLTALHADIAMLAEDNGEQPEYVGGMAFDASVTEWQHFGSCYFFLPRIELKRYDEEMVVTLNLRFDDRCSDTEIAQAHTCLDALLKEQPLPPLPFCRYQREDRPSKSVWQAWVNKVTQPEQLCHTPKIVLSRETCLTTAETLSPWPLLSRWQASAVDCFHFGLQLTPQEAFIGCPPERLYLREGQHLVTEALAGTTRRANDVLQDKQLAAELLLDTKNALENQCVHQQVLTQLEPLVHDTRLGEAHIVKLRSVQHIRRLIHAELKDGITDRELMDTLPPTPAVGGLPRAAAMDFIRQHECHQRGWYAGAVGRVSQSSSDLAVAIRCAYVTPGMIRLYAGAGIVAGSRPDEEWHELDAKIADIMSLLGVG